MTWQAWSLLILGLTLLTGFVWYERSGPPSRVVALVASLAAIAVAGRVTLAAVPNLVATTDIVLFAGYALGPAPGFVVGAISGLISNFWLGQGPWTPWQMLGWGMTGLMGYALSTIFPKVPNRFLLAAAAGIAAVLFGVLMNFSTMVTFGGEASTERFAALQVRAVPFDLMHVAGNVVLAFVAGPAMLRMLNRFKDRMTWRRRTVRPGVIVLVVAVSLGVAGAQASSAEALDRRAAVGWLGSVQNSDGGFGSSPGEDSNVVTTAWAVLGLAASGVHPLDLESPNGSTSIDFLRSNSGQIRSTGDMARTTLALQAAGVDPSNFEGRNLVTDMLRRRRSTGSYEGWPNTTAFVVIALRHAGVEGGISKSIRWLIRAQNSDGGWGVVANAPSDPDSTGAVLQAVGARQVSRRGIAYLRRAQRPSGGFALAGSGPANAQSTAWALQGLIAKGENPEAFSRGSRSGPELLTALQMPDGHVRYSTDSDQTPVWVTANALVAASERFFPVPEPARAPDPAPAPSPGGGGSSGASGGSGGGSWSPSPYSEPSSPSFESPPGGSFAPPQTGIGPSAGDRPSSSGGSRSRSGSQGRNRTEQLPTHEVPEVPIDAYQGVVEEKRDAPSPVAPAGLGLGLAGLTAGGLVLVGRRRRW